jgi:hypothetical protein
VPRSMRREMRCSHCAGERVSYLHTWAWFVADKELRVVRWRLLPLAVHSLGPSQMKDPATCELQSAEPATWRLFLTNLASG